MHRSGPPRSAARVRAPGPLRALPGQGSGQRPGPRPERWSRPVPGPAPPDRAPPLPGAAPPSRRDADPRAGPRRQHRMPHWPLVRQGCPAPRYRPPGRVLLSPRPALRLHPGQGLPGRAPPLPPAPDPSRRRSPGPQPGHRPPAPRRRHPHLQRPCQDQAPHPRQRGHPQPHRQCGHRDRRRPPSP
ncbi:hypothetical protein P279_27265 [Rhodobacteraceae bacterium PD-2]|nr:hypothetical protein P279_27265 [Rhodobacteraceae bacterium PD-2]